MWQQTYKLMYNHPVNTNTKRRMEGNVHSVLCVCVFILIWQRSRNSPVWPEAFGGRGCLLVWKKRHACINWQHDLIYVFKSFMVLDWTQASSVSPVWQVSYVCHLCVLVCDVMWGQSLQLSFVPAAHGAGKGSNMLNRHYNFKGEYARLQKNPNLTNLNYRCCLLPPNPSNPRITHSRPDL